MAKEFYTLEDIDFKDKTVLVRVDLNCPIDPQTDEFMDYRRVDKHGETIKELVQKGAKVVVLAHQGRPGAEYDFTTLDKHVGYLSKAIGKEAEYVPDIIGPTAVEKIKVMKEGDVLLLDNVRFLSEELLERPADVQATTHFVKTLAPLVDYFVNDAFAAAHRSQPSLVGFTQVLKSAAGRVMEKEIEVMEKIMKSKKRPSVFVVGGSKVKNSLNAIEKYFETGVADKVLTSGLVASMFLLAKGYDVTGLSHISNYNMILEKAKALLLKYNSSIEVPMDLALDKHGKRFEVSLSELPLPYRIADIGKGTIGRYKYIIESSGTCVMNGPAGVFEEKTFAEGTNALVRAIADSDCFSVIGGGHVAGAVKNLELEDKISHISTGGGACINYLAGEILPGIQALKDSYTKGEKKDG